MKLNEVNHITVGQQIKSILEEKLGKDFLVTSTPCTYDYHIQIIKLDIKKTEMLQVNLTKSDNIQLRVQKPDDTFYCFLCPEQINTVEEKANYLITQYLHNKKSVTESITKVVNFHKSLLDTLS